MKRMIIIVLMAIIYMMWRCHRYEVYRGIYMYAVYTICIYHIYDIHRDV